MTGAGRTSREGRKKVYMADFYMGYLVELKKKRGFFEDYGELQKVLCSREKLAELLTKNVSYHIISARIVNVREYQMNHPEEQLEEWGIRK